MSSSGSATPTRNSHTDNASITPPVSRSKPLNNSPTRSLKNLKTSSFPSFNTSLSTDGFEHPSQHDGAMVSREFKPEDDGEENSRSSPSYSSHGDGAVADTEEVQRGQPDLSSGPPAPVKKKRTRTLTTPHQSAVLHALLAQSRFPTTAMREEVGRSIGLSARKVQIWFQNQRQKARRPRSQSAAPLSRPPQYAAFPDASGSSAPATGDYYPHRQPRGYNSGPRESFYDRQDGPPYRHHPPADALLPSDSNQLSGPGIPGLDPRRGYLYSDRDLPIPPPQSTMNPGGPYRSFKPRYRHPSQSPPISLPSLSRPGTGYSSGRYERDMARTLPPLNFDSPHLRPSFSTPGLRPIQPSAAHSFPPNMGHYERPRRSSSEFPFAYSLPDGGDRFGYDEPSFALRSRPQWDTPTRSWDSHPESSSISGPSRRASEDDSSLVGHETHQRSPSANHQPSTFHSISSMGGAELRWREQRSKTRQGDEAVHAEPTPARSGRYDPVRGIFISNRRSPPPPSSPPRPLSRNDGDSVDKPDFL